MAPRADKGGWFYRGAVFFCRVVCALLFRFHCRGYENIPARGGVILAANHQSFLDPVLVGIGSRRPVYFMARRTLFDNPVFGKLIRALNAFPVNRGGLGLDAIREITRLLEAGRVVVVFPEGTRTRDGELAEFRAGVMRIAARAGAPVVPVAIEGAFRAWPRWNAIFSPRPVTLAFGAPLSCDGTDRDRSERHMEELRATLTALRAQLQHGG